MTSLIDNATPFQPPTRTVKTFAEAWLACQKGARIRPKNSYRSWDWFSAEQFHSKENMYGILVTPTEVLGQWEIQEQYWIGTFTEAADWAYAHPGKLIVSVSGDLSFSYTNHGYTSGGQGLSHCHVCTQYMIPT